MNEIQRAVDLIFKRMKLHFNEEISSAVSGVLLCKRYVKHMMIIFSTNCFQIHMGFNANICKSHVISFVFYKYTQNSDFDAFRRRSVLFIHDYASAALNYFMLQLEYALYIIQRSRSHRGSSKKRSYIYNFIIDH